MAVTTFLNEFKTYYNITSQTSFMVFGSKLQSFITAKAATILANDIAFGSQTSILYEPYSGNIQNISSSTQKWITPQGSFMNGTVKIALVLYEAPSTILLRVTHDSIKDNIGYPGVNPIS